MLEAIVLCVTRRFKIAIHPDEIHFAGSVNLGGWQNATGDPGSDDRFAPTRTAIGGGKRKNAGTVVAPNGDDDRAIRLNEGLAAGPFGFVCGSFGCTPGVSSIGGGAHQDKATFSIIVPLDITMAVEWAGGAIIADNPVFVEIGAATVDDSDRFTPGFPSIRRKVDQYCRSRKVISASLDAQRRDEPGFMCCIIGNRRVACAGEWSSNNVRDSWQETICPVLAPVSRSCPANIDTATIGKTACLKCRNNG